MIILTEQEALSVFKLFMPDHDEYDAYIYRQKMEYLILEAILESGNTISSIDELIVYKMEELTLRLNRSFPE
jgi:hypothetical protein